MAGNKVKIVLDTDVLNHFARAGKLPLLTEIFPECDYLLLDVVKKEVPILILASLQKLIDSGKIKEAVFGGTSGENREYFRLTSTAPGSPHLGKGESACMVYCRFHNDVVGSNNGIDIYNYCDQHGIIYLTTNDFFCYAIKRGLLTIAEAEQLVQQIRELGSTRLKVVDFNTYACDKMG